MRLWWWQRARRGAVPAGWQRVLLLLDPEAGGVTAAVVRVAAGLTARGGSLGVLVPVLIPLTAPLAAPPGEETERAVLLLERAEQLAGRHGVTVDGRLLRGRSVRGMLREAVERLAPGVVVLHAGTERWRELAAEIGAALPVIVPPAEGEDRQ